MNNIIVYGTLKKQNLLHYHLEKSQYIKPVKLRGFKMFNTEYSFPWAMFTEEQSNSLYGEMYAVDKETLTRLDAVESEGSLYQRINLQETKYNLDYLKNDNFATATYLYLGKLGHPLFSINKKAQEIPYGYWTDAWLKKEYKKVFNLNINNKIYSDNAEKIVFDMRFDDYGEGSYSNAEYMAVVNRRLKNLYNISVNKKIEEIFLTDLILNQKAFETISDE